MENKYKFFITLAVSVTIMSGCSPYGKLSDSKNLQYKIINQQLAEAKEKNLGIVLMPTFHVPNVEKWKLALADEMNQRALTNKTKMIWRHRDFQDSVFLTTTDTALALEDTRASWMNYGDAHHTFQIFFVKPGIYGLIGSETLELDKTLEANTTQATTNKDTLGQSFVQAEDVVRYVTDTRWSDAIHNYEARSEWYCTQTHASGTCLSGAENKYTAKVTTRPAGYYEGPYGDKKPALVYTSFMLKPLATFEVKAGEVILTDAFFATGKNVYFQNKTCVENDKNIQCNIKSFSASLIKASPDAYNSAVLNTAQTDKNIDQTMVDILKKAQYRPLEIFGKRDKTQHSKIGDMYTIK